MWEEIQNQRWVCKRLKFKLILGQAKYVVVIFNAFVAFLNSNNISWWGRDIRQLVSHIYTFMSQTWRMCFVETQTRIYFDHRHFIRKAFTRIFPFYFHQKRYSYQNFFIKWSFNNEKTIFVHVRNNRFQENHVLTTSFQLTNHFFPISAQHCGLTSAGFSLHQPFLHCFVPDVHARALHPVYNAPPIKYTVTYIHIR